MVVIFLCTLVWEASVNDVIIFCTTKNILRVYFKKVCWQQTQRHLEPCMFSPNNFFIKKIFFLKNTSSDSFGIRPGDAISISWLRKHQKCYSKGVKKRSYSHLILIDFLQIIYAMQRMPNIALHFSRKWEFSAPKSYFLMYSDAYIDANVIMQEKLYLRWKLQNIWGLFW